MTGEQAAGKASSIATAVSSGLSYLRTRVSHSGSQFSESELSEAAQGGIVANANSLVV